MQRLLIIFAVVTASAFGQNMALSLPNAPSALADRNPVEIEASEPKKCGPWTCWDYHGPRPSTWQVLKSKAFLGTFLGDLALSSLDAEISKEGQSHHVCHEGGEGLAPYPSRWQLYKHNLPENAAVGVTAFLWVKFKGPKWVLPLFLAHPAYVHAAGVKSWTDHCW